MRALGEVLVRVHGQTDALPTRRLRWHPVPTFPDLLARRLATPPGQPLVTFYDDTTGERTELSVTTYRQLGRARPRTCTPTS